MKIQLLPLALSLAMMTSLRAQSVPHKLDAYLRSANQFDHFNGVALVAQRGQVLLHKAYGLRNVVNKMSNDTATRFPILSITKTFTSTLILLLQEQGKLSVQNKLSLYFPTVAGADSITIHHLLTHTSGLFDYMSLIDEADSAIVCHPVAKQQVLDLIFSKPLAFRPGSTFAYSNSGYFLLGLIIEKLTGKPYEQAVREMIFQPLGMTHSGFDYLHLPVSVRAQGYDTLTAAYQSAYPHVDSTVVYSAGAIYSTARDLYTWGRAVANQQLLSANSWKQALTARYATYGYGYGWMTGKFLGKRYIGHTGGYPGFKSSFVYYPQDDLTIILLENTGNYHESQTPMVLALTAIPLKKPYSPWIQRTEIPVDEAILQRYVGSYRVNPKIAPDRVVSVSLENGKLFAQANDEPKVELFAETENRFFLKAFNTQWTFTPDRKGQIKQALVHENGIDIIVKRIPSPKQITIRGIDKTTP